MKGTVPPLRVRVANPREVQPAGDYVLYWMVACRRPTWNFSLQRAIDWCEELAKPLLLLEALRCDYPWSSRRLHRFILDGFEANRRFFRNCPATYYPYVETARGEGKGLLAGLAARACVVVTDDYPCFFLPHMIEAAGRQLQVRLEAVDSNGVLPLRAASKVFARAYDFRRFLHDQLRDHLARFPLENAFQTADLAAPVPIPEECLQRWPAAGREILERARAGWKQISLREDVEETDDVGGFAEGSRILERFVESRLPHYAEQRNHPTAQATSDLSPWLHFGHISSHEILRRVLQAEDTEAVSLRPKKKGKVTSWWDLRESAQQFLDQLLTWRELGFNFCWQREDYMDFRSLPDWAQKTLAEHTGDTRDPVYSLDQFETAATHDELWNAAQRQLLREGRIHNYMRMVWGKKILHWSATPREAAQTMIHLNDKYALDGRDPNSYSGIFWCLGRYDRAWGPERPIFGKVRYMTTANTARKYDVSSYLLKYSKEAKKQ